MTATLLARYDDEMRRNTVVAGYAREQTPHLSRFTTHTNTRRLIIWHDLPAVSVETVVDQELRLARGQVPLLMWKLYAHDPSHAALRNALLARGFREKDHSTLMLCSVDSLIEQLEHTHSEHDVIVAKPLTTAQSLDAYLDIWNDVWPDEPNASYVNDYRVLLNNHDPGILFFVGVTPQLEPVSTGYMFHQPGDAIGLLCGGTTKTQWRRQRAYRSTLIARAHAARARGAAQLAVEASPESAPILRRLGFQALSTLSFLEIHIS